MKNHHFLIFSILFFLLPVCSQAQQNMFNMVYQDSPPTGIQALSIAPAFDNGYMIAGSAWPEPKGMVLKTDSPRRVGFVIPPSHTTRICNPEEHISHGHSTDFELRSRDRCAKLQILIIH